jgi:hypothetical protein
MFPAIDLPGYQRRTTVPAEYVQWVETETPGFTVQAGMTFLSRIYANLRKRYGASLPFGQTAPILVASGTAPPNVGLSGTAVIGSLQITIACIVGGPLGTAQVKWSLDGGRTFPNSGVITSAMAVLAGTGLVATFPVGTYSTDNVWAAATPVPEAILGWLVALIDVKVLLKKFSTLVNFPEFKETAKTAVDEISQAANSKDGLFDLPVTEDAADGSAITTAGPLWSTNMSPYAGADFQERVAACEDASGWPTMGGDPQARWPQ